MTSHLWLPDLKRGVLSTSDDEARPGWVPETAHDAAGVPSKVVERRPIGDIPHLRRPVVRHGAEEPGIMWGPGHLYHSLKVTSQGDAGCYQHLSLTTLTLSSAVQDWGQVEDVDWELVASRGEVLAEV